MSEAIALGLSGAKKKKYMRFIKTKHEANVAAPNVRERDSRLRRVRLGRKGTLRKVGSEVAKRPLERSMVRCDSAADQTVTNIKKFHEYEERKHPNGKTTLTRCQKQKDKSLNCKPVRGQKDR